MRRLEYLEVIDPETRKPVPRDGQTLNQQKNSGFIHLDVGMVETKGTSGCTYGQRRGIRTSFCGEPGSTVGGSKLVIFVHLNGGMKIHFLAWGGSIREPRCLLFSFQLLLVAFAVFIFFLFTVLPSTDSLSNVHPLC